MATSIMKKWEEMSNKEKAELTIKDIERRKEARKIGKREADSFMFEKVGQAKKERDKIRCRAYRGRW